MGWVHILGNSAAAAAEKYGSAVHPFLTIGIFCIPIAKLLFISRTIVPTMVKKIYCTPADQESANPGITRSDKSRAVQSIGLLIEQELRRQERSVSWLSRKIHCDRRNIYFIFGRDSIDTDLLLRISQVLGVDFFACFSSVLNGEPHPPIKALNTNGL